MSTIVLKSVLTAAELATLRDQLRDVVFASGTATNRNAKALKRNEQADPQRATPQQSQLVQQALFRHPEFGPRVLPKKASLPFFARYGRGMAYGPHIDEAVLRGQVAIRTDLSCTVFVSEPEEYEGGALVIDSFGERRSVKLAAGDAVIYPASSVHEVVEVTAGVRLVALCWFESLVRSAGQRQILSDLDSALTAALDEEAHREAIATRIGQVRANLMRRWVDS